MHAHIALGEPLRFSVRDAQRQLLLARGQVIHDARQLEELFERGALVEIDEITSLGPSLAQATARRAPAVRPDLLAQAWSRSGAEVRQALLSDATRLSGALTSATDQLIALIQQNPAIALAQVVRQPQAEVHYGADHSIHAATACHAAACYLGWAEEEQRRAFQAALTMNLAILDLQARLATQVSPLTTLQREAIHHHPTRGAEQLERAGITDQAWLDAVARHHEQPDGSGYPQGLTDVSELASLLRFADVYTARLSARANRPAMSAQQAGRELHLLAAANPLAGALIKAFGIFPPGSLVRLASGELGLVVRNGEKANHPLVLALTDAAREPRVTPLRRDTSRDSHAVLALLSSQSLPMRLTEERIASLIAEHGD